MNQIMSFFKDFNIKTYKVTGKTVDYYKVVVHGGKQIKEFTKNFFYKDAKYYLQRKYVQFNTEVNSEITKGSETTVEHRD